MLSLRTQPWPVMGAVIAVTLAAGSMVISGTGPRLDSMPVSSRSALATDVKVVTKQTTSSSSISSPAFSTRRGAEVLLAFLGSDGPSDRRQSFRSVTGAGLTWHLASRANAALGDAEVWDASAPTVLTNIRVTGTRTAAGYGGMMLVVSLTGASSSPIASHAHRSASGGPPAVSLTGVPAGSKVFGVGNDWDTATPRTLTAGQSLLVQNLDTSTGDAQWVQRVMARTTSSRVVVSDSTPSSDQWNLAAIAVRAAPPRRLHRLPQRAAQPTNTDTTEARPDRDRGSSAYSHTDIGAGLLHDCATPMPAPTPTSIPRVGVANQANTGYENAPGYPGHLTDCSSLPIQSNTTYKFCDFPNGLRVGSSGTTPVNVTFYGCRFASANADDADVADYGDNITFSWDTFEPSTVPMGSEPTSPYAAPIAHNQSYQYGIDQRHAGAITVDHSDFWGFANGIQFGYSSQAKPVVISNSWFHNTRNDGGVDHTDGILENYGGLSYITITHDTIVGDGNTNAIALQGRVPYDHLTVTDNYLSGYGWMVALGGQAQSTNVTFTGNIWSSEFKPEWGPVYPNRDMFTTTGLGNTWRNNSLHVAAGTTWLSPANQGLYWWPGDFAAAGQGSFSSSQILGHTTDYGRT